MISMDLLWFYQKVINTSLFSRESRYALNRRKITTSFHLPFGTREMTLVSDANSQQEICVRP